MGQQSYLIDTNILIGLEDYHNVLPAYSEFLRLAAKHKVDVFVHEAARDDIARDKDLARRSISLSKIAKYRILKSRRGLTRDDLEGDFGPLRKPNDVVDAALLYSLKTNAVDFLVTQDRGLHERAARYSSDLARRVLFVGDATGLLAQTYEPKDVPIRHVSEVDAHTIDHEDEFFDSLRDGYDGFDDWWIEKCIGERRPCWTVYDGNRLAGLVVRKDETASDTDAITKAEKVLKICTFKVRPEMRGVKLGELLLRQVLWFAQLNGYGIAYVTAYSDQNSLISLLQFYGFGKVGEKTDGELIFERGFGPEALSVSQDESAFEVDRKNYPRFVVTNDTRGFGIPIREGYHDALYPDLWNPRQGELFDGASQAQHPVRPGNTIRKVYLCRAKSALGPAGSVLFFYKGASRELPSQAMTAIGVLEEVSFAHSTKELMLKTGGRSVYSENELEGWKAAPEKPVKVISYLLIAYAEPPILLGELKAMGVFKGSPAQSIFELRDGHLQRLLFRSKLGFGV